MANTIRNRTRNLKESKEKKNLQKLLAGSDFSLGHPEDMEMDYYDYNVTNAGAAPGSYLGMDPAFLVWIPPLNDEDITEEVELESAINDREGSESRSSNVTPNEEIVKILQQRRNDYLIVNSISKSDIYAEVQDVPQSMVVDNRSVRDSPAVTISRKNHLQELAFHNARRKTSPPMGEEFIEDEREKETSFTKSPVDNKQISDLYDSADIQFADDEEEDEDEPVVAVPNPSKPVKSTKV